MNNLSWKRVKPLINDKAIEIIESESGIKLPADIISCIKLYNGGRPDKDTFDTQSSQERLFKILLSFNESDVETVFKAIAVLKGEGLTLLPLASDPGGNYICYDPNDGIVLWLHETNTTEKIADNFTDFLSRLY